jgi:hypothetical protein
MDKKSIRLIASNIFIFFLAVYIGTASSPGTYLFKDSLQRFEVTKGLVENLDPSIPDGHGIKGEDGRDYSLYGIGWSVLAVPFYILGKYFAGGPVAFVAAMSPVAGAATATVVFLFCVSLGYCTRSSLGVAMFYGLGTLAWPFAKQPMEHVFETFFILLTIYFLYLYLQQNQNLTSRLVFSAISFGIALNIRSISLLALPGLVLMFVICHRIRSDFKKTTRRLWKSVAIFGFVLFPFAILILWYNHYRFGSVYETGYQLMAVKSGLTYFSGTWILTGLRGLLISPGKGFFYYSPVAILFFFSIVPFYKRHVGPATGFLFIIVSYLLFFSTYLYWHGDWTWGPRFLLPITPLFIIPSAELLESNRKLVRKPMWFALVYPVFLLSLAIQIMAVSVYIHKYFLHLQMDEKIPFSVVGAEGIPDIAEPPSDIYFAWDKSPILAQIKYIHEIGSQVTTYEYNELPPNATEEEEWRASLSMNVFDFWWVQQYYKYNNLAGFYVIWIITLVAIVSLIRIGIFSRSLTTNK